MVVGMDAPAMLTAAPRDPAALPRLLITALALLLILTVWQQG